MPREKSMRPKPSNTRRTPTSNPRRRMRKACSRSNTAGGELAIASASLLTYFTQFFNILQSDVCEADNTLIRFVFGVAN